MCNYFNRHTILLFAFFFFYFSDKNNAQSIITGKIVDEQDSTAIPYVSVILNEYKSNKIISFDQSNLDGGYELEVPLGAGIYTIYTSRVGYHKFQREIVLGSDTKKSLVLDFSLLKSVEKLEEVVVRPKPPIVVKEDTIIYDIHNWAETHDQTLEAVLNKIPGFEILANGNIKVNGLLVNKVVINGEELSDLGAALITKSLSPSDISEIEIRMNEKNNKLKESLIDSKNFVVLDIKLKDELKKSFFGKLRVTAGYQDKLIPGGYGNLFSLKKKFKSHLFFESDRFGNESISMRSIRNLGAEAVEKMLSISPDFNAMSEKEEFDREIYGFKDYTNTAFDIIGFTSRYSITPKLDLFVGSYNSITANEMSRIYDQEFEAGFSNKLQENSRHQNFSSKNKIELRYDQEKIKGKVDLNLFLAEKSFTSNNLDSAQGLTYNFSNQTFPTNIYNNLLLEYAPNQKLGIQLKASYSHMYSEQDQMLIHNDSSYIDVLFDFESNKVFNFSQLSESKEQLFIMEGLAKYRSRIGAIAIGVNVIDNNIIGYKEAKNNSSSLSVPLFTAPKFKLSYTKTSPIIEHSISFSKFLVNSRIGYATILFPSEAVNQNSRNRMLEYRSSLSANFGGWTNFDLTLSKEFAPFKFAKILPGYQFSNYQNVMISGVNPITAVPQQLASFSSSIFVKSINTRFEQALLHGRIENANEFQFSTANFIPIIYNQLNSYYTVVSLPMIRTFNKFRIHTTLEPEVLLRSEENIDLSGFSYLVNTDIRLLGLKLRSIFRTSPINFLLYPKYTRFIFSNTLSDGENIQDMFASNLSAKIDLFKEKLLLTPSLQLVNFYGLQTSEFINASLDIDISFNQFHCFLSSYNIFNNKEFVRQSVFPTYFIDERSAVFHRYIKIGLEFKFK